VIITVVLGVFFGFQLVLGTSIPVRVVESGSMCLPYNVACDDWTSLGHPFAQTLHKGDIIIIQAVKPTDLKVNYPNSDIIVYENPTKPDDVPIVHRIVTSYTINGTIYFQTKGDSNSDNKWPDTPSPDEYDSNRIWTTGQGVPQDLVLGKVVMRIPYFGWITLILNSTSWGLPLVIGLILLLVVFEFVIPIIRGKTTKPYETEKKSVDEEPSTLSL
jgi:hypothetical protein